MSAIALGSLVFAVIEGPHLGWWTPKADLNLFGTTWGVGSSTSPVPWAFALAALGLVLFLIWESTRVSTGRPAILDLRLFKLATFSWGNLTAAMVAVGEFALLFVLPLYLVNVIAHSVMEAGVILAAMALGAFSSGALARHLAARFGSPGTVILGLLLEMVGVLALSAVVGPNTAGWILTLPLVVYGLGLGLASAQLTGTVLRDVPVDLSGQGSATQSMFRQVGSALGTAFAGTALAVSLARTLPSALADIGTIGEEADQLTQVTRTSAGSNILHLRADGGAAAKKIVTALTTGFADGVRAAMLTSAGFLFIGLIGSVIVWRVAARGAVGR